MNFWNFQNSKTRVILIFIYSLLYGIILCCVVLFLLCCNLLFCIILCCVVLCRAKTDNLEGWNAIITGRGGDTWIGFGRGCAAQASKPLPFSKGQNFAKKGTHFYSLYTWVSPWIITIITTKDCYCVWYDINEFVLLFPFFCTRHKGFLKDCPNGFLNQEVSQLMLLNCY